MATLSRRPLDVIVLRLLIGQFLGRRADERARRCRLRSIALHHVRREVELLRLPDVVLLDGSLEARTSLVRLRALGATGEELYLFRRRIRVLTAAGVHVDRRAFTQGQR